MKKLLVFLCAIALVFGIVGSAGAAPLTPNESGTGFDLFDAVNLLLGTEYTGNDDAAMKDRQTNVDEVWTVLAGNREPWAMIGISASNTNSFGFYTDVGVGNVTTELWQGTGQGWSGDGSSGDPFTGDKKLDIGVVGDTFGWYLDSDQQDLLFSETTLNGASFDYMTTYALPELLGSEIYLSENNKLWTVRDSAYLIGWEDIIGGGDQDYNDGMFLVARIEPVPEPATMLLLGSGLMGLAIFGRKKFFKKN